MRNCFPALVTMTTAIRELRPRRTAGGIATACPAPKARKSGDWWFGTPTKICRRQEWRPPGQALINCWIARRILRHYSKLGVTSLAERSGERQPTASDCRNSAVRPGWRWALPDRKSVVEGKRVAVRVELGGRGLIKKKKRSR